MKRCPVEFNRFIIESTLPYTCCYKPNLAFYLADGIRGIRSLIRTMRFIPDDVPVILDCKVGDIGSTMDAYMRGFFDKLEADAITINPLMGSDVLEPLLQREKPLSLPSRSPPTLRQVNFSRIKAWTRQWQSGWNNIPWRGWAP